MHSPPNYFNEVIKKITGRSAGHHIRERIILEAKRLALYSEINMKEIAYELGFIDLAISVNFLKLLLAPIFPISKNSL